jgi:hypothetical protein
MACWHRTQRCARSGASRAARGGHLSLRRCPSRRNPGCQSPGAKRIGIEKTKPVYRRKIIVVLFLGSCTAVRIRASVDDGRSSAGRATRSIAKRHRCALRNLDGHSCAELAGAFEPRSNGCVVTVIIAHRCTSRAVRRSTPAPLPREERGAARGSEQPLPLRERGWGERCSRASPVKRPLEPGHRRILAHDDQVANFGDDTTVFVGDQH